MSERMSAKTRVLLDELSRNLEAELKKGRDKREALVIGLRNQSKEIAEQETTLAELRDVLGLPALENVEPTGSDRDKWIAGMRELCDFLEQHPDAPISGSEYLTFTPKGETNAELLAAVRAAAEVMGVKPYESASAKWADATRYFGPITYSVRVHLKDEPEPQPEPADAQAEADIAAAVNLVPVDVDPRVLDDIESLGDAPETAVA